MSLAWPRVVTTPWLWPCVAVGTLLVLLAVWLLLRDVRRRRAGLDEPQWHAVNTGATPVVVVSDDIDAIPVLTRRQMREAAQAHAAKPRSGAVPAGPRARRRTPAPGTLPAASRGTRCRRGASATRPVAALATSRRAPAPVHRRDPGDAGEPRAGATGTPAGRLAAPGPGRHRPRPHLGPGLGPAAPAPGRPSDLRSLERVLRLDRAVLPVVRGCAQRPVARSGAPAGVRRARLGGPERPGGLERCSWWVGAVPPRASDGCSRRTEHATPGSTEGAPGGRAAFPPGRAARRTRRRGTARPTVLGPWHGGTAAVRVRDRAPGPTPVTEPERSGPAGWSAVPPPPGARVRPGSPAGPDSSVHAGRPTWARPAADEAPSTDEPAAAGSRADAWRRAWGLPPTEGAPEGTQSDTDTRGEQR